MKKVWILSKPDYTNNEILGVFASPGHAELKVAELIKDCKKATYIREHGAITWRLEYINGLTSYLCMEPYEVQGEN